MRGLLMFRPQEEWLQHTKLTAVIGTESINCMWMTRWMLLQYISQSNSSSVYTQNPRGSAKRTYAVCQSAVLAHRTTCPYVELLTHMVCLATTHHTAVAFRCATDLQPPISDAFQKPLAMTQISFTSLNLNRLPLVSKSASSEQDLPPVLVFFATAIAHVILPQSGVLARLLVRENFPNQWHRRTASDDVCNRHWSVLRLYVRLVAWHGDVSSLSSRLINPGSYDDAASLRYMPCELILVIRCASI